MKPVDQSIIDKQYGDCMRACIASILELPIEAVPHLQCFPEDKWYKVMYNFFWALDYDFFGTGYMEGPERPVEERLSESPNIDGYVMAAVPSRTWSDGVGHSAVMNLEGVIVHDPNPNRLWQDVNVLESGDLEHWSMFGPKEDEDVG